MTKGLVTRIGEWLDNKWAAKATCIDVQEQETRCSQRHIGMMQLVTDVKPELRVEFNELLEVLRVGLMNADRDMADRIGSLSVEAKDVADLKKRLEQLELYVGMKRVADPTKAPVAKSAFSM
jgi:hypothetical protein